MEFDSMSTEEVIGYIDAADAEITESYEKINALTSYISSLTDTRQALTDELNRRTNASE